MADQNRMVSENRPGRFFVDAECIACDTCSGIAPDFFALASGHTHAFVQLQPNSEKHIILCQEALRSCPVGAIGELN